VTLLMIRLLTNQAANLKNLSTLFYSDLAQ